MLKMIMGNTLGMFKGDIMEQLELCPFCGGEGIKRISYPYARIEMWECSINCMDCGASTYVERGRSREEVEEKAVARWNRRYKAK